MPELIRARAAEFKDKVFFVCDEDRLTYAEADRRSQVLAKALLAVGARKGTRIGLLYPNNVNFAVAFLAVTRIGALAVPFSTLQSIDELRFQLANSDTEILLGTKTYRTKDFEKNLKAAFPELDFAKPQPLLSMQAPSLRQIFLEQMPAGSPWSVEHLLSQAGNVSDDFLKAAEASVRPADRLVVVYTSGSTSAPKGVIHSHGPVLEHLRHISDLRSTTPDEVLFSSAPFFWIGGLSYAFIRLLQAGGRVVCSITPTGAAMLDTLEREKPTIAIGFPASVAHLPKDPTYAKRDFSTTKRGNMPPVMSPESRPRDIELHHNMLGSTETDSVYLAHSFEGENPEKLRGSFGKPLPGFDVRITDPDTGKEVPRGTIGEIWVRGPYVMDGYVGKERREVFTPDGYYRTGDLAVMDEDGYIFFKTRLGDMIKTSGANVSPREVENVIIEITGARTHVLGLDDAEKGQIVAAAIASDNLKMDEQQLRDTLKAKVSPYKIPKKFLFLKEADIPMMSSGKLDKRKLVDMFR